MLLSLLNELENQACSAKMLHNVNLDWIVRSFKTSHLSMSYGKSTLKSLKHTLGRVMVADNPNHLRTHT